MGIAINKRAKRLRSVCKRKSAKSRICCLLTAAALFEKCSFLIGDAIYDSPPPLRIIMIRAREAVKYVVYQSRSEWTKRFSIINNNNLTCTRTKQRTIRPATRENVHRTQLPVALISIWIMNDSGILSPGILAVRSPFETMGGIPFHSLARAQSMAIVVNLLRH